MGIASKDPIWCPDAHDQYEDANDDDNDNDDDEDDDDDDKDYDDDYGAAGYDYDEVTLDLECLKTIMLLSLTFVRSSPDDATEITVHFKRKLDAPWMFYRDMNGQTVSKFCFYANIAMEHSIFLVKRSNNFSIGTFYFK
ncbi:hypothetical protein HELRODRAFT_173506 [Helobdella robusta]|uniref:Uncharacterized protein n=1 Tax=Helobdella robusta TaxID=6412 RepID=T1F6W8_HELRO|nr:hypothetical protein HELRODRAFT_173506 [Helobdella robusta]ESO03803.1 hypothetical protein HELRODRAFT_173506 [Helobdella robusta]